MIVTCPSCSVRYLVDARALGASGRKVRCAKCAHLWYQAAPPDAPVAPDTPAPVPAATLDAPKVEPPMLDRPRERARRERVQLPALPRRKRRWGLAAAWAAAAVVVVAGLGYAAVVERDRIVGSYPATAALYARLGFPASDTGIGLEFRNVTTSREMEDGLPALVIDGEVRNVSSVARAVPKLVVILRDKSEHDLLDWTVEVATPRLAPGESAPFHTSIKQPAEAAAGVVVTFSGGERG